MLTTMKQQINYQDGKTSLALTNKAREIIGKYGIYGVSIECILVRMCQVMDQHPELKRLVTEYDGYKQLRMELRDK